MHLDNSSSVNIYSLLYLLPMMAILEIRNPCVRLIKKRCLLQLPIEKIRNEQKKNKKRLCRKTAK